MASLGLDADVVEQALGHGVGDALDVVVGEGRSVGQLLLHPKPQGVEAGQAARTVDAQNLPRIGGVSVQQSSIGGIASLDDLRLLRELGCEGAVAGSALLRRAFTLQEARAATVRA